MAKFKIPRLLEIDFSEEELRALQGVGAAPASPNVPQTPASTANQKRAIGPGLGSFPETAPGPGPTVGFSTGTGLPTILQEQPPPAAPTGRGPGISTPHMGGDEAAFFEPAPAAPQPAPPQPAAPPASPYGPITTGILTGQIGGGPPSAPITPGGDPIVDVVRAFQTGQTLTTEYMAKILAGASAPLPQGPVGQIIIFDPSSQRYIVDPTALQMNVGTAEQPKFVTQDEVLEAQQWADLTNQGITAQHLAGRLLQAQQGTGPLNQLERDVLFKIASGELDLDNEIDRQRAMIALGMEKEAAQAIGPATTDFTALRSAVTGTEREILSVLSLAADARQRGALDPAIANRLRVLQSRVHSEFALPPEVIWDAQRGEFVNRPGLEGRKLTPEAEEQLRVLKPVFMRLKDMDTALTRYDEDLTSWQKVFGEIDRETELIKRYMATEEIDNALEADFRRKAAEAKQAELQTKLLPYSLLFKLMENPFALAFASKSGLLKHLSEMLGFPLSNFFSGPAQAGQTPSPSQWKRMDDYSRQLAFVDWTQVGNTGTMTDFERTIMAALPPAGRAPTQFRVL